MLVASGKRPVKSDHYMHVFLFLWLFGPVLGEITLGYLRLKKIVGEIFVNPTSWSGNYEMTRKAVSCHKQLYTFFRNQHFQKQNCDWIFSPLTINMSLSFTVSLFSLALFLACFATSLLPLYPFPYFLNYLNRSLFLLVSLTPLFSHLFSLLYITFTIFSNTHVSTPLLSQWLSSFFHCSFSLVVFPYLYFSLLLSFL